MLYHKELFSSAAFLYHALVLCENTPLSRIRESLKDWVYLGETWGTFTCSALCWAKSLQSRPAPRPHSPRPARTLCLWGSPGKSTGVGCHTLLQGTFLVQESNSHLLQLLHRQTGSLLLSRLGSPCIF